MSSYEKADNHLYDEIDEDLEADMTSPEDQLSKNLEEINIKQPSRRDTWNLDDGDEIKVKKKKSPTKRDRAAMI